MHFNGLNSQKSATHNRDSFWQDIHWCHARAPVLSATSSATGGHTQVRLRIPTEPLRTPALTGANRQADQNRKVAGKGRTTTAEPMASMEYSRLPNPADGAIFRSDPFASEQADDAPSWRTRSGRLAGSRSTYRDIRSHGQTKSDYRI